jgi:hypothetical protein
MDKLTYFRECFATAEKRGLIKFEVEKNWLTVSYKETLTSEGKDWKWSFLCSQDLRDYTSTEEYKGEEIEVVNELELVQRVTMMLCETLRSTRQDVNIYRDEYVNVKKPFCFCIAHEGGHYQKNDCIK